VLPHKQRIRQANGRLEGSREGRGGGVSVRIGGSGQNMLQYKEREEVG